MHHYENLSDLDLVELLRADNQRAFNELFERYHSMLLKFAYSRVGEREVARDLVQTLFLDLWERRHSTQVPGEFRPYLYTIIRNRVIDHYKHQQVSQRYIDSVQSYLINLDEATDHLIRHRDLSALIEKEVAALPKSLRDVFELSRSSNYTRKEIAEALNITEIAVKNRMHRALDILRKALGDLSLFL